MEKPVVCVQCVYWCARGEGEANGDSEICPGPET